MNRIMTSLTVAGLARRPALILLAALVVWVLLPAAAWADTPQHTGHTPGGEVNIKLPSLEQGSFFGMNGHQFLLGGLVVCVLGLLFGLWTYLGVRKLPVHRSMAEIT